jgi:hypothetical protein
MKLANVWLSLLGCLAISCATTKYRTVTCPVVDLSPLPQLTVLEAPDGGAAFSAADALKLAAWLETVFEYRRAINQATRDPAMLDPNPVM